MEMRPTCFLLWLAVFTAHTHLPPNRVFFCFFGFFFFGGGRGPVCVRQVLSGFDFDQADTLQLPVSKRDLYQQAVLSMVERKIVLLRQQRLSTVTTGGDKIGARLLRTLQLVAYHNQTARHANISRIFQRTDVDEALVEAESHHIKLFEAMLRTNVDDTYVDPDEYTIVSWYPCRCSSKQCNAVS